MTDERRGGRPRASSREELAEAACELFLEQGYDATSVVDIATRAGVSRSSFFNYFASKSDVLWAGLDVRIDGVAEALAEATSGSADDEVRAALAALAGGFSPDSLALALSNAEAMGLAAELERDGAMRQARIARIVAERLRRGGAETLAAEVRAAAYGGAVLAAVREWAAHGPGRAPLGGVLDRAVAAVG